MSQTDGDYPITALPFTDATIEDAFWQPRINTAIGTTIPFDFRKCEETGRIDNFAKAGGLMDGAHVGTYYDDSDVFKVVEGAAYALAAQPDKTLEGYVDALIEKMAAAQEADGYLYTARTIDPAHVAPHCGPERWSNLAVNHELYNVGHMYEAAVAYYEATGKRRLLDVAIRNADLIDTVFGAEKLRDVPGHQEIELGLARLYRVTGEARYLRLAKFFLDERGQANGREVYGPYCQDHLPAVEQGEAVGHAVRAGYQYAGMTDIAALTGDDSYASASERLWRNVVERKLALTGGVGALREGEAFGADYELPNLTSYNETCAAIANIFWKSAALPAQRRGEVYRCAGAHAVQRLPVWRWHGRADFLLRESVGMRWRLPVFAGQVHVAAALVPHLVLPDECRPAAAVAGAIHLRAARTGCLCEPVHRRVSQLKSRRCGAADSADDFLSLAGQSHT